MRWRTASPFSFSQPLRRFSQCFPQSHTGPCVASRASPLAIMIMKMLRSRFASVFRVILFPATFLGVFTAIVFKVALSLRAHRIISPPTVSSTTEVATCEATCLQELSDAEEEYGPYSPQLSSALRKLSDFYQKNGESAQLESMLQRTLEFEERTAGYIHGDTTATSFKLIDVYIRRGKLNEAVSLLEKVAEGSRKLGTVGTDTNSDMGVMYRTEVDFELRALFRLGLEFRKRNLHDEAVNVQERAFESYSKVFGDTHTTTIAMAKVLSFSYLLQFYQQPLRIDRPRHQCVMKLAQLCDRVLKVERGPIWALGLMCLASNDAANASFAFKQPTHSGSCSVCKEQIKPRTRWLACKSCLFLFVCDGCYQKWTARTEQNEPITATCAGHAFWTIGVEDPDRASTRGIDDEEEVSLWLHGLIDQKSTQATGISFLDYWERLGKPEELREFRNPVYFYESDSLPAHIDEVKVKSTPLPKLMWHKSWMTVSVPLLFGLFFAPKGFSNLEWPQWKLDEAAPKDDHYSELTEHAHAILRLAGIPTTSAPQHDMLLREPDSVIKKLYQKFQIAEPGNTIRLLALLPGESSRLKATISCVNLSSHPIYEALSYVWGEMDAESSYSIDIDGIHMEITPNLYHALHALRMDENSRVLWVDSLCINQNDNKDKENQISMMLDIYKSAQHVVVYLGEPNPGSLALFSFFNRNVHDEDLADKTIGDLVTNERDIRDLLEAYIQFCHLPWWNRIWVQQEYSLSRSNPTFHLGRNSVPASALLRDWKLLQKNIAEHLIPFAGDFKLDLDLQKSWQPIMRQVLHVYGVLTLRSAQLRSDFTHIWLPRGVLKKVNLRCTNPRDKIYGMRSFLDPLAQAVFTPNYSESVDIAFHKFATWVLAMDGWQQVFWWYPYRLSLNMPSWVPDFTKPIPEAAMLEHNLFDYGKLKKSSPCPLAIWDGVLAMEGYLLDSVDHVHAINQPDWPSTVRELWFLENVFAETPSAALLRKAPPVFKALPMLHTRDLIRKWVSPIVKRDMESIVFELPPFNVFEKYDILKSAFDPAFNEVKDAYKTQIFTCERLVEELRGLPKDFELTSAQARIVVSMQILEHLNLASAFAQVCARLSSLRFFLEKADHSSKDLFGAALFDCPNLLGQIKHLRTPSLPRQFGASQTSAVTAKLRDIKVPTNNGSSTDWIPRNESGIGTKIQLSYESLQHHITACEHEEEVKLRVRLVLSFVDAIRSFPDSIKRINSKIDSSYLQYRDQQIANNETTRKTILEDHERQTTLSQIIMEESRQYFDSLAARFPGDDQISALITTYKTLSETGQSTSETLKITTETAAARLEEGKPQILANTMYAHDEKAFEREAYEHAMWLSGRTFFSTKSGLVGMGCQGVTDIQMGDQVIVLKNTEFPMVIRETEDKQYYTIVGYAIVRSFKYEEFEKLGKLQKPLRQAFYFR